MVSFDLSFLSMLIEDIVEEEGALWTEGRILWLYINRCYYQVKRVQFLNSSYHLYVGVSSGAAFRASGCFFYFLSLNFFLKDCMQTYLFL